MTRQIYIKIPETGSDHFQMKTNHLSDSAACVNADISPTDTDWSVSAARINADISPTVTDWNDSAARVNADTSPTDTEGWLNWFLLA